MFISYLALSEQLVPAVGGSAVDTGSLSSWVRIYLGVDLFVMDLFAFFLVDFFVVRPSESSGLFGDGDTGGGTSIIVEKKAGTLIIPPTA